VRLGGLLRRVDPDRIEVVGATGDPPDLVRLEDRDPSLPAWKALDKEAVELLSELLLLRWTGLRLRRLCHWRRRLGDRSHLLRHRSRRDRLGHRPLDRLLREPACLLERLAFGRDPELPKLRVLELAHERGLVLEGAGLEAEETEERAPDLLGEGEGPKLLGREPEARERPRWRLCARLEGGIGGESVNHIRRASGAGSCLREGARGRGHSRRDRATGRCEPACRRSRLDPWGREPSLLREEAPAHAGLDRRPTRQGVEE